MFQRYLFQDICILLYKSIGIKINLLTWEDGKKWERLYLTKITRNMLKDEQLKVILIMDRGNYSR